MLNDHLQASERHDMAAEASATPQEWMDDLALMRHFVKWTTKEPFGAREEVQYLWQEVVTDMALEYPFLMVRIGRVYRLGMCAWRRANDLLSDSTAYYP